MADRSGGYRLSGRDMLAYGFNTGEPWADDRRALEHAFREADAHNDGSRRTYSENTGARTGFRTRTGSGFEGDDGSSRSSIASARSGGPPAAYLYQERSSRYAGGAEYGEAPGVRWNQSSGAHGERTTSENGFISGIIYPQSGWAAGERYEYSNRRPEYNGDVRGSSRRWDRDDSPPAQAWRDDHDRWRDSSPVYDDPHSRWDGDSDWDSEDGHQGDGSVGSQQGMFDYDRDQGSPEYGYEYEFDSEGDYYYDGESGYAGSGSEVSEAGSEYGSHEYFGSSGDEESYASESDVASNGSYEVDYYDSD